MRNIYCQAANIKFPMFLVAAIAAGAACGGGAAGCGTYLGFGGAGDPAATRGEILTVPELGLSTLLPTGWHATEERGAVVVAGEEGTRAYFATITVQTAQGLIAAQNEESEEGEEGEAGDEQGQEEREAGEVGDEQGQEERLAGAGRKGRHGWTLDDILEALVDRLGEASEHLSLDYREPDLIGSQPAMRYRLSFEREEMKRSRIGALIATDHGLIDVALGAVGLPPAVGLDVLDEMLASIRYFPPAVGPLVAEVQLGPSPAPEQGRRATQAQPSPPRTDGQQGGGSSPQRGDGDPQAASPGDGM